MTCKSRFKGKGDKSLTKVFKSNTRKGALNKAVTFAQNKDMELCSVYLTK